MRLILHPGTHKTGTTSIQKVLFDNKLFLREHGLFYPSSAPYSGAKGQLQFSHDIAEASSQSKKKVENFLKYIKKEAKQGETIIISAEPLYRHVVGKLEGSVMVDPDYLKFRREFMETVARLLQDFETEVILFRRDYDYFLNWLYKAMRRNKAWGGSFADFEAKYGDHFAYEHQFKLFYELFPKVTIFSYEHAKSKGLISFFFNAIGFPCPPGSEKVWERPTKKANAPLQSS